MNEQLREFIESERSKGLSDEDIRSALLSDGGWSEEDLQPFFRPNEPDVSQFSSPEDTIPIKEDEPQPLVPNAEEAPPSLNVPQERWNSLDTQDKSIGKLFAISAGLVLVLLVGIGVSSGMVGSLFSKAPYSQDNLIQGLVQQFANVESLSYNISSSVKVEPRDADAKSFEDIASEEELQEARGLFRDNTRLEDIESIKAALRNLDRVPLERKQSLLSLKEGVESGDVLYFNFSDREFSVRDPLTEEVYEYTYDESLDDYTVKVAFETNVFIESIIQSNRGDERDVKIDGKNASYSKDTSTFVTLNESLINPMHLFDQSAIFASNDFMFDIRVGARTSIKPNSNSDAHFTLNVEGDFADIGLRVGGELIKKDNDLYVLVTDFPGLLAGIGLSFPMEKDTWFKISLDNEAASPGVASIVPEVADTYREQWAEFTRIASEIAHIADEEQVLTITNTPEKEKREGGTFYRYDVELRKDNFLRFIERVIEVIKNEPILASEGVVIDEEALNTLRSGQYDLLLEYIQENLTITLFIDDDGFLREHHGKLALVPSDSIELFRDKQVTSELQTRFDEINKPVIIEAPQDAVDLSEYVEESFGPQIGSEAYANDAIIISSMQTIRVLSEIYYDENDGSYGNSLDSCQAELFSGDDAAQAIQTITDVYGEEPQCRTSDNTWAVSARMSDGVYWCIDSTGDSSEQSDPLAFRQTSCN